MVLMRYGIIQPVFSYYGIDKFEFPLLHFVLLVFSVVLVAADGYMINDYFDVKTDQINRPDKIVIGKFIKASRVYSTYFILNIIAMCLSLYISYKVRVVYLFVIFPLTIGLLWFYSTTYKRQLLLGNLLVSLITALVPLLVVLYEMPLIHTKYIDKPEAYLVLLKVVFSLCGVYSVFAFMITFIRELVKDAEDFDGDKANGRNTLLIVFGLAVTRKVITTLILITIALLVYIYCKYLIISCLRKIDIITMLYFVLFLIIPLTVVIFMVVRAKGKRHFFFASSILKFVMLAGILYTIVMRIKFLNCS